MCANRCVPKGATGGAGMQFLCPGLPGSQMFRTCKALGSMLCRSSWQPGNPCPSYLQADNQPAAAPTPAPGAVSIAATSDNAPKAEVCRQHACHMVHVDSVCMPI